MGISRDACIPRVRDLLGDTPYSTTSTTTGTGATVTVVDGTKWAEGDVGEWQTGTVGYEQFLVTADPVGNDLPVSRGYNGTTAETHASGDRIFQGPAFSGRQIQQALESAIRTTFPFIYKSASISVTPVPTQVWYTLVAANTQAILGLIDVTQVYGTAPGLRQMRFGRRGQLSVGIDLNAPTDLVSNGVGLYLPRLADPDNTVYVRVMQAITGAGADTDIEDNVQFPVADYLISFAAGRLTGASEIPRVASGADLETTGTVPAGARQDVGRTFMFDAKRQLELLTVRYRAFYNPLKVVMP